jgi:hypothetical protein
MEEARAKAMLPDPSFDVDGEYTSHLLFLVISSPFMTDCL